MTEPRYPRRTTDADEDSTPPRSRVPPARQLCHGSAREIPDRPKNDRCPVCERKVAISEVSSGRRDPKTRELIVVYIVPTHMMRRDA